MTSEKRFKKKEAEMSVFDAFHAGFIVPLARFLDGEEGEQGQEEQEEQEDEVVIETPKPKPKPKPTSPKPAHKEEPPTQEESEVADGNADAE